MKDLISRHLRDILVLGPRAVGSSAEQAAADLIADRLGRLNLNVSRENFQTSYFPLLLLGKGVPLLSIFLLLAVVWIVRDHPAVATGLLVLLLAQVPLISFFGFHPRLPVGGTSYSTANIVGRSQPIDPSRPTLMLVAHYDSKSQTLPLAGRFVCVVLPIVLGLGLTGLTAVVAVGNLPVPIWPIGVMSGLIILFLILQIVSWNSNRSPGAIDNASGLAVLLTLADRLALPTSIPVNLVFLASGAEELGLMGAREFIRRHSSGLDPNRTVIFNFDSLGVGTRILLVGGRGTKKTGLVGLIRQAVGRYGFSLRFFPVMIGAAMDHIPFCRAGFSALSFTQTNLRAAWRMHSSADELSGVNVAQLADFTRAVEELVGRIFAGPRNEDRRA